MDEDINDSVLFDTLRTASGHAPRRRGRRDVYCYFDNDVKVHAPFDAARLAGLLGAATPLQAGTSLPM